MITLEALRTALMVADPYDGIDQLIRSELAAGRTTKSIHDELLPLVKPTRKTPGFTEDADEALLGALDALLGNCHPDCQYTDPIHTTNAISREVLAQIKWLPEQARLKPDNKAIDLRVAAKRLAALKAIQD